jgi:hypothetical protein
VKRKRQKAKVKNNMTDSGIALLEENLEGNKGCINKKPTSFKRSGLI